MSSTVAPYLYTEARLNIEPTYSNSTLHISTEPTGLFSGRKRSRPIESDVDQDEDSYAKRHIATEGSIFFRRSSRSPRTFLWRVLQDRNLLEIQSVDLAQSKQNTQESVLTFALSFANPIRLNGIAFADPEQHDALEVFVLTTSNELFTFTLSKGVLLRDSVPTSEEFDTSTCWKMYKPTSFSFKNPYKLVATSSLELFISLHDGSLLRLDRKAGDSGSSWRETFFSEGGWGSTFRGLIPFRGHNTVRFGDVDLESSTPTAIAMSPDSDHLFTVSLDHTLKAWNMKTGKTAVQTDLLGENEKENVHNGAQYLIDPSQGSIMQIVEVQGRPDGDMYYIVTNSPKDHRFKFWAIRDADSTAHGMRDLQSEAKLIPPLDELMNTNVWQIVEFRILPGHGWRQSQLWIRVRAGAFVKIFTLTFDLLAPPEDVEDVWQNNWAAVDEGSLSIDSLMNIAQYPAESDVLLAADDASSPSERWLDFLFYPGRFSTATLETALFVYRKGLKLLTDSTRASNDKPLKRRLCDAISAKIEVNKTASGQIDFERYQSDIAAQWHTYFGLVRLLHSRRADSLSLAFDAALALPWIVRADFVSPVRTCSEFEVINHNSDIFITQEEHYIVNSLPLANYLPDDNCVPVARLLIGARAFRRGLSAYFQSTFEQASTVNALQLSTDKTVNGVHKKYSRHVLELYDACALHSEVSNEDFDSLTESMQDLGGLGELTNDIFLAAIERLAEPERGSDLQQALTRYGDKTTIRGAQETLQSTHEAVLDLLALVVFMAGDLEPEELSSDFNASELYQDLMAKLKEHKILLWLASNVRQEPSKRTKEILDPLSKNKRTVQPALTLFESIFIGDWQAMRFPNESMSSLITYWSRAWTYGANLAKSYDGVVMHIMGNLIKHGNHELATEFEAFLPSGPWAQYLRGRLYLATGDFTMAGVLLKRCAEDLSSKSPKIDDIDTSNLLKGTERSFFNDGLPRFYMHVSSLYEALKIHTYTADFASLALEELGHNDPAALDDDALSKLDSRKRNMHNSPAAMQVDMAMEELHLLRVQQLKEEILSRIFSASLQTSHYRRAFDVLLLVRDPALRKANLQSLISSLIHSSLSPSSETSMSQQSPLTLLTSLPFPSHMYPEIDQILLTLTKKHLPFSPVASSTATPLPQYHQVMYAWRMHTQDFRGAASILYDRLQLLRSASSSTTSTTVGETSTSKPPVVASKVFEPDDETLLEAYLVCINALACLGKEDGWVLVDHASSSSVVVVGAAAAAAAAAAKKRKIVTLEDVRREYQTELDRRSDMLHGRFPLLGGGGGFGMPEGIAMEF
ncbi:hypothetical protein AAFC00_005489 [Neodothiora populina]|uniref:Uncharacterized protein n=1 Tax=Neodothiora populina TaxID=2781224 RepID=A0ABR3PLD3_9PEZI